MKIKQLVYTLLITAGMYSFGYGQNTSQALAVWDNQEPKNLSEQSPESVFLMFLELHEKMLADLRNDLGASKQLPNPTRQEERARLNLASLFEATLWNDVMIVFEAKNADWDPLFVNYCYKKMTKINLERAKLKLRLSCLVSYYHRPQNSPGPGGFNPGVPGPETRPGGPGGGNPGKNTGRSVQPSRGATPPGSRGPGASPRQASPLQYQNQQTERNLPGRPSRFQNSRFSIRPTR